MSESTNTVRSFDPAKILGQFFNTIFGEQKGWIYTATKEPQENKRGAWEKIFFKYPEQIGEMIEFIIKTSTEKDIYYSPAIFSADRSKETIRKEDFRGTSFVWADFDNGLPTAEQLEKVPAPTMKIRTSNPNRQHWYWNLNFIEQDPNALEKITRALTYHLGADLSGWDYQQVLRPPGTIHHGSGKTVTILEKTNTKVSIEAFMDIPEIPDYVWDVEINEAEIEPATRPLMRYKIPDNDIDLFHKKIQEEGKRSSALTRAAYVCAEVGMTNTEIYSVLKFCDDRWKKFSHRPDQKKRLIGIIRYVRQKYPLNIKEVLDEELPCYRWGEFASMKIEVEWIVDGLIQKNGLPMITGSGNVGKTHMTFQLACHMVVGKPFLKWEFSRPMTLAIVSNELSPEETQAEIDKIVLTFSEEEQNIIAKNLIVIPLGYRLPLDKPKAQELLLRRIEQYKPEGLFFDSIGQSLSSSPSNEEVVLETFDFVKKRINQGYGSFAWFIHHMRKAQMGNKKPKDPDDIYGSAYIFNNASTVVNLWKDNPSDEIAEFNYLKVRFAKFPKNFKIKRKDPCGFDVVSGSNLADLPESFSEGGYGNVEF